MYPSKVPIDEGVTALGLVSRVVVEAEVSFGVFVPGVSFEKRVLVLRSGLYFAPVAVQHVLPGLDETASTRYRALIDRVRSHKASMRAPRMMLRRKL